MSIQFSVQSCLIIPVTQELPVDTHALLFPLPWSVLVRLSLVTLPVIWVVSFSSRILLTPLPLSLLAPQYLVGLEKNGRDMKKAEVSARSFSVFGLWLCSYPCPIENAKSKHFSRPDLVFYWFWWKCRCQVRLLC